MCSEKNVKVTHCTILWNVDDLNILHVDSDIVSSIFSNVGAEYVKIAKMTIIWVKVQKNLGMTINYSSPGKVILSIADYIGKKLDDIPEEIRG